MKIILKAMDGQNKNKVKSLPGETDIIANKLIF